MEIDEVRKLVGDRVEITHRYGHRRVGYLQGVRTTSDGRCLLIYATYVLTQSPGYATVPLDEVESIERLIPESEVRGAVDKLVHEVHARGEHLLQLVPRPPQ